MDRRRRALLKAAGTAAVVVPSVAMGASAGVPIAVWSKGRPVMSVARGFGDLAPRTQVTRPLFSGQVRLLSRQAQHLQRSWKSKAGFRLMIRWRSTCNSDPGPNLPFRTLHKAVFRGFIYKGG